MINPNLKPKRNHRRIKFSKSKWMFNQMPTNTFKRNTKNFSWSFKIFALFTILFYFWQLLVFRYAYLNLSPLGISLLLVTNICSKGYQAWYCIKIPKSRGKYTIFSQIQYSDNLKIIKTFLYIDKLKLQT